MSGIFFDIGRIQTYICFYIQWKHALLPTELSLPEPKQVKGFKFISV